MGRANRPQLLDPCIFNIYFYPTQLLSARFLSSTLSLATHFDSLCTSRNAVRQPEGYYRVDLTSPHLTIYLDSTSDPNRQSFCDSVAFSIEYWKGQYGTPAWRPIIVKAPTGMFSELGNNLDHFMQPMAAESWVRYSIINANGARDQRTACAIAAQMSREAGREILYWRESHGGILGRLSPRQGGRSIFLKYATKSYIPSDVDLFYLQFTNSYEDSNRWLLRLVQVLSRIVPWETLLSNGYSPATPGEAGRALQSSFYQVTIEHSHEMLSLYEEWGENRADDPILSFVGYRTALELLSERQQEERSFYHETETLGRDIMLAANTSRPLRIFLCHSSSDKAVVSALFERLSDDGGFEPWLDSKKLLPGQDWHFEITKAVRGSDVVLVCLSRASINKEGYIQRELKLALDVAEEKPDGTIFIIPTKLEECSVPSRLTRWQWVDLFEAEGYEKMLLALKARAALLPR
jgi:hypothetical protein